MSRWKASGIHLSISLAVAMLVGLLIYFIWYPPPYFVAGGGGNLMLIIMGVDVVIGPLLTFVVFKSGKKSLKFDLAVIALLQSAAFCYGLYIIASARPAFIVAAVDSLIVVGGNELDDADLAQGSAPEYRSRPWFGPRLVGAIPPRGKEALDVTMSAIAGKDIDEMPKYYVPYEKTVGTLLEHSHALSELSAKSSGNAAKIERFLATRQADAAQFRFVPLRGRTDDYTLIITAKTAEPVAALTIDPWL